MANAAAAAAKKKKSARVLSGPVDTTFLVLVILLLGIGLVMLFSASYANAYYLMGNSFHYIIRQLVFAAAGLVAMGVVSFIDYHILHKFAYFLMGVTLLMLVIVFAMPALNHAHRWIFIPPTTNALFTFQPSDIAKFSVVVLFAHWISINYKKMDTFEVGIVPFVGVLGVLAVLLILEPHLSGTILIVALGGVMMIVGGSRPKYLGMLIGAGVVGGPLLITVLGKWDRAWGRIQHWLNPMLDARGDGYQTIQSLYAIGSGGLMGAGIGNARQKFLFLPEPQNDFIFAIVCEELGFVGATLIILLFALLVWRGFVIAVRAKDRFGTLLAVGLTAQIGIQVILNIAVVTNTMPNTGIALPFFSYGGTALMMLLGEIGFILNISRQASMEKE